MRGHTDDRQSNKTKSRHRQHGRLPKIDRPAKKSFCKTNFSIGTGQTLASAAQSISKTFFLMLWTIVRGPRRFLKAAISMFAAGTVIGSMLVFNAFINLEFRADSGPPLTLEDLVSMRDDERRLFGTTIQGSCQSLWKQKVVFDRKAFEATYCDGFEQRRGSGLSVFRGVLHGTELQRMQGFVRAIPYPRRYICGLTDFGPPPVECVVTDAMLAERYPRLRKLVNQAVAADKLSMMGFHHVVRISAQQRVSELMARPKVMRSFATAAVHAGSLSRDPDNPNSMVLGYLTEQLGIPLYSGFHDWHFDGIAQSERGESHLVCCHNALH